LFVLRNKFYHFRGLIARFINPRLDEDSSEGILSEEEMKTIIALSEILIPWVEKSGTNHGFIRNHVNYKTNNVKGYLKEYRNGVKILEETSNQAIGGDRRFYELNIRERDRVLGSILWRYSSEDGLKRRLERILISRRKIAFRDFVVRDIIVASFKEPPVGWAIVGYSHYPGVPAANPREYTEPLQLFHE
jgi:hypothetical protein